MEIRKFEELEKEICDFAEKIHKQEQIHYEGPFITGKLEHPEILFLSFNPGGGEGKFEKRDFEIRDFFHLDKDYLYARRLKDIFGYKTLEQSCETYIESFFATKDLDVLKELFKQNHELRKEHDDLMKKLLELVTEQIKPKMIVCIGLGVFDYFCEKNETTNCKNIHQESKKRYLLNALYKNIPVYGTIHLSGARPSRLMLEELKTFFQQN